MKDITTYSWLASILIWKIPPILLVVVRVICLATSIYVSLWLMTETLPALESSLSCETLTWRRHASHMYRMDHRMAAPAPEEASLGCCCPHYHFLQTSISTGNCCFMENVHLCTCSCPIDSVSRSYWPSTRSLKHRLLFAKESWCILQNWVKRTCVAVAATTKAHVRASAVDAIGFTLPRDINHCLQYRET